MRPPQFREAVVSGYDKADVDAFVSRVIAALTQSDADAAVSAAEIPEYRFRKAWAGAGYRKDEVDQWLDEAEYELHTGGIS